MTGGGCSNFLPSPASLGSPRALSASFPMPRPSIKQIRVPLVAVVRGGGQAGRGQGLCPAPERRWVLAQEGKRPRKAGSSEAGGELSRGEQAFARRRPDAALGGVRKTRATPSDAADPSTLSGAAGRRHDPAQPSLPGRTGSLPHAAIPKRDAVF